MTSSSTRGGGGVTHCKKTTPSKSCKMIFAPPGFEPGSSAWEADILPLDQICL